MLHPRADSEENHRRFVRRVVEHETVWALEGPDGYAWCESDGEDDREVLVFWSDRAYAERARKAAFPEYQVREIALFDFLFRWLTGMADDGRLVGASWTGDLAGIEVEPDDLKEEILDAMPYDMLGRYQERLRAELATQAASRSDGAAGSDP